MEPRIQYAKTEDGVSIAFWVMGEGLPLVQMPGSVFSHIQLEWQIPQIRRWHELMAEKRMAIRYDGRGTGLSDRDVADFSIDAHLLDLEAVLDRLGLERAALFGTVRWGPVAIAYAAHHPKRVSHLVLWQASARGSDYFDTPQMQTLFSLMDRDWDLFLETAAHQAFGWSEGEFSHQYAQFMRECVTREVALAVTAAAREVDTTPLLGKIECPTLVAHIREAPFPPVDAARRLAAGIPNARLAPFEGESVALLGNQEERWAVIDDFLGEAEEAAPATAASSGLVTILFTDMESSTALTQRLGDARAQELVREHNAIVREALKACGGSEIKHTGDGIMASFPSASGALDCAVAIQRAVAALRQAQGGHAEPVEASLRVRIGLNAGEPVVEEDDLFGASVQLARRVCDHAEPGQIVVADVVRQLATGKGFLFSDLGDVVPKGFEEPVRLYEVRWREDGSP